MGSMLTIPFARSQPYSNPQYVQAMADLMLQRGQAAQANALLRAQNTQQMYQGLGQTAMATMAQIGNQRDEATNRKMIQAERDRDYAVKQQEMKERAAERRSNELWRQQQYETEQKRYADLIGDREADQIMPNTPVGPEAMGAILGTSAARRFRTTPGQAAQPAWETEPVGDAMADAGPATAAVPMSYMRNPNAQESIALQNAAMAKQDREARDRQFAINEGQEELRARQAQSNWQASFNQNRDQFNRTETRLGNQVGGVDLGLGDISNLTPEEILAKMPPDKQALYTGIREYRIDPNKAFSLTKGQREQAYRTMAVIDPTYDASQFNTRSKLRADFTSGKTSQNLKSMNQLVGHLAQLDEKAAALGNTRIPLWNDVKNKIESETGNPAQNNFALVANAVIDEAAAVFKATGATDESIKQWAKSISSRLSPDALVGVRQEMLELLGSRLGATLNQYESGMGRPKDFDILSPKTRKILNQWGLNANEWDPPVENPTVDVDQEFNSFNTIRRQEAAKQPPIIGQPVQVPSQQFKFRPGGG